jgi:hypothetical protein
MAKLEDAGKRGLLVGLTSLRVTIIPDIHSQVTTDLNTSGYIVPILD